MQVEKQENLLKHMDKELQELHATHKAAVDDLNILVSFLKQREN